MLSIGSRNDGRKGLGLGLGFGGGREMEENELEEGEACYGREDDVTLDPDVALSYIDERLQDVLGHFQKDFEGGVSAENLGAKFGGYGSFLPSYQRSPSICPHKVPNHNAPRSPYSPQLEGARQNLIVPTCTPDPLKTNSISTAPHLEISGRKDVWLNASSNEECTPQHNLISGHVNGNDHNTLKVRIKVGPNNDLARNNAAIYSGLGLDISPSSSPGDSPDGSGELSPDSMEASGESPMTIIQVITCIPVVGGYLLSPLSDSLLHLMRNGRPFLEKFKTGILCNNTMEKCAVFPGESFAARDAKGVRGKNTKSIAKDVISAEMKTLNCKHGGTDITSFLEKEIDIETPAGRELVSNALNIPLLSSSNDADKDSERRLISEVIKGTNVSRKDKPFSLDLPEEEPLESTSNLATNKAGDAGINCLHLKGKLNSNSISVDKASEERKTSNDKIYSHGPRKEGKGKTEKSLEVFKADPDELKGKKDHIVGPGEPVKLKALHKGTSCEQNGEKTLQGKDQSLGGKRKTNGSQTNVTSSMELPKKNLKPVSAVAPKEKKEILHSRGDHSENKSNSMKLHKETNGSFSGECHRDMGGNLNVQKLESRVDSTETLNGDKSKDLKFEHEKHAPIFSEKTKEKSGITKVENPLASGDFVKHSECTPLIGNRLTYDAVSAPTAPVVIEEHWVCCDRCQKWRLLPYGTNPDHLPKKWLCSMLYWLPGMNRCNISEEETTKALNALYQVSVPENQSRHNGCHDVATSGITFAVAQHFDEHHDSSLHMVPSGGKKKHWLKDGLSVPSPLAATPISNSLKKNQQESIKSRSLNDGHQDPLEPIPSENKSGFHSTSKSASFSEKHKRKQKEKHKVYPEGVFIEQGGKHLTSKNKKKCYEDGFRASKKIKAAIPPCTDEDWHSGQDDIGKSTPSRCDGLSTKAFGEELLMYKDSSSSKDLKCDAKDNMPASRKKSKPQVQVSTNGIFKENFNASDMEKSNKAVFSAKKRKEEWQETQVRPETLVSGGHLVENIVDAKEEISKSEMRKEKKARVSNSEGKVPSMNKTDVRMDKMARGTTILLSGTKDFLPDEMEQESRGIAEKEHQRERDQGNVVSQENLDGLDLLKRDLGYAQTSMEATSSSSKVSASQKRKPNIQETRGSPVESVSSSPLKISNPDQVATRRNPLGIGDAFSVGLSVLGSPRRCSDGEVDGRSDRSGTRRKEKASFVAHHESLESNRAAESTVLNPMIGACDYHDSREANQMPGNKAKEEIFSKIFGGTDDDPSPSEFDDLNMEGDAVTILNNHNKYLESQWEDHGHEQEKLNNNGSTQLKSGKSSSPRLRERHQSSKYSADKGKGKVSGSFSDQEDLHSTKNGSSLRYETDFDYGKRSTRHQYLRDEKYRLSHKEKKSMGKNDLAGNRSTEGRRDIHFNRETRQNLVAHGISLSGKRHKDVNSRVGESGAISGKGVKSHSQENLHLTSFHEDEKLSNRFLSDQTDRSEMACGRGKSHLFPPSGDKSNTQSRAPCSVSASDKGSKTEALSVDAANSDALKVHKQPRKVEDQNGAHHSSLRYPTLNGRDAPSSLRKDGNHSAITVVMKEARDLKHKANRLKKEGLEHESTSLYFQAALKFLHVASLLEVSSTESARCAETILLYSDTAKLCKFCAQEYEKCKEMAAAVLAYKCMEVAYMKVVYSKNSSASKDRHELQTALQLIPHGESPTSSASDVDNLNNHGMSDKAASAKGMGSPQIAGTHVIAARSRPSFVRLLNFAQDVNFAMEASRKSRDAFAAASVSLEEACNGNEGMSSVRRVLDFSFHDVEELLQLVRLSMESIRC